jgi:hypothetical protein
MSRSEAAAKVEVDKVGASIFLVADAENDPFPPLATSFAREATGAGAPQTDVKGKGKSKS